MSLSVHSVRLVSSTLFNWMPEGDCGVDRQMALVGDPPIQPPIGFYWVPHVQNIEFHQQPTKHKAVYKSKDAKYVRKMLSRLKTSDSLPISIHDKIQEEARLRYRRWLDEEQERFHCRNLLDAQAQLARHRRRYTGVVYGTNNPVIYGVWCSHIADTWFANTPEGKIVFRPKSLLSQIQKNIGNKGYTRVSAGYFERLDESTSPSILRTVKFFNCMQNSEYFWLVAKAQPFV